MNFLDATVGGSADGPAIEVGGLTLPVDPERFDLPARGTPVVLGIRPEGVVPEGHGLRPELGADFEAPIGFAEMLGNESLLFASLGQSEIVSRMQRPRLVEANEVVRFRIDGARVHVFDKQTQNSVLR
jgi:ABC-type sugar transport system ATPase subunit